MRTGNRTALVYMLRERGLVYVCVHCGRFVQRALTRTRQTRDLARSPTTINYGTAAKTCHQLHRIPWSAQCPNDDDLILKPVIAYELTRFADWRG